MSTIILESSMIECNLTELLLDFTFIKNSNDFDFIVKTDKENSMLFIDGSNDSIGIGTNQPKARLHVDNSAVAETELVAFNRIPASPSLTVVVVADNEITGTLSSSTTSTRSRTPTTAAPS